ncbi:hypothetical protein GWK47_050236 [Chionoecetes opilio]|uniref:Major facilitator superfamily associated domain-containing protein n=1 Tax=Chionoecetes opilio TaxID=41210 RepID=A0A8J5CRA1_CHIOP|nr:hypothetical protein GWK47_050236 [Chionoecetes opilio]
MKINKKLIPIKLHYFCLLGSVSTVIPFVMVIAVERGIPVWLAGTLNASTLLVVLLVKPAMATLADTFPSFRRIIFLLNLNVAMVFMISIYFVPSMQVIAEFQGQLVRVMEHVNASDPTYLFSGRNLQDSHSNKSTKNDGMSNQWYPFALHIKNMRIFTIEKPTATSAHYGNTPSVPCNNDMTFHTLPCSRKIPFSVPSREQRPIGKCHVTAASDCLAMCGECDINNQRFHLVPLTLSDEENQNEEKNETWEILHMNMTQSSKTDLSEEMYHYRLEGLRSTDEWDNISIVCERAELMGPSCPSVLERWEFWLFALLLVVANVSLATVTSFTDAIIVDTIGELGHDRTVLIP